MTVLKMSDVLKRNFLFSFSFFCKDYNKHASSFFILKDLLFLWKKKSAILCCHGTLLLVNSHSFGP